MDMSTEAQAAGELNNLGAPAAQPPLVAIVEYRPRWSQEFEAIADRLRSHLGPLALRIDHIGSTAVPGLAAKDVIDVQVTVAALSDDVLAAFTAAGYTRTEGIWRDHVPPTSHLYPALADPGYGDDEQWAKWFMRAPAGQRRTNTHVRVQGRANQRYPLLFRDYLRAHPATAAAYAELKRRLAANLADLTTYPAVKDPAVDLVYLAAEEWAAATGWRL